MLKETTKKLIKEKLEEQLQLLSELSRSTSIPDERVKVASELRAICELYSRI